MLQLLQRIRLALRPPARQWYPHAAPERFHGLDDLIAIWHELDRALMPPDDMLVELETAVLLAFDQRTTDPSAWQVDRVRLLVDLLARLRA